MSKKHWLDKKFNMTHWLTRHPDFPRMGASTTVTVNKGTYINCKGGGLRHKSNAWDVLVVGRRWPDERRYVWQYLTENAEEGWGDPRSFKGQLGRLPTQLSKTFCPVGGPVEWESEILDSEYEIYVDCKLSSVATLGLQWYERHGFGTGKNPDRTGQRMGGDVPDDAITLSIENHYDFQPPGQSLKRAIEGWTHVRLLDGRSMGRCRWYRYLDGVLVDPADNPVDKPTNHTRIRYDPAEPAMPCPETAKLLDPDYWFFGQP